MFRIDLIRHGRTKGNEERRYVGRTDEGLSPAGRQELCEIRECLDGAERSGYNLDSEKRACSGNAADGIYMIGSRSAAEVAGIGDEHARMHCRMLCFKVLCAAVRRARISYFRVSPR